MTQPKSTPSSAAMAVGSGRGRDVGVRGGEPRAQGQRVVEQRAARALRQAVGERQEDDKPNIEENGDRDQKAR